MSELLAYAALGFRHITDPGGLDHVLFLVALAAGYRPRDWRGLLWVVTAFTAGHSLTLALAVVGVLAVPGALVEFLIPVTIVAAAVETVWRGTTRRATPAADARRAALAGLFGLVHGAGFAGFLRSLFVERVAVPLLGFNLGLEVGQVLVLAGAGLALAVADRAIAAAGRSLAAPPGPAAVLRLRAAAVSAAVALVAAGWAVERAPW